MQQSSPLCWWHKSLFILNQLLKRLNILYINILNIDLKNLTSWVNANKISLNVSKTEFIIFLPKSKSLFKFQHEKKVKWKKIISNTINSFRYFGVKIDSKLSWKSLVNANANATKLNRTNAMLYKVKDFALLMQIFLN